VINPLLPNYRGRELAYVFETARPRAIYAPGSYRDFDHERLVVDTAARTGVNPVHVVCDRSPSVGIPLDDVLALGGAGRPIPERDAAAVSELIFTSGTEATPKAIMHTEQTTNFSVRVAATDMQITGEDVVWMPSPLGHSTGFNYGLRFALYHGLPLVLQDRWDAAVAADLVARERCSYTLAATTFLRRAGGRDGAPGRASRRAPLLRLWRRTGAARAGRGGGDPWDPRAPPLRLHRGARRDVEPSGRVA
jgi:acyl-coenzyme A synthetase/AMP-(fatty) acid ligase